MAVRKAITFLNKLLRHGSLEAYAFCEMPLTACDAVVDYTLGIHAMIPKTCFVASNTRRRTVCCWCRGSRDRSAGPEDLTSGPVAFHDRHRYYSCVGSQSAAPTIGTSSSYLVPADPK